MLLEVVKPNVRFTLLDVDKEKGVKPTKSMDFFSRGGWNHFEKVVREVVKEYRDLEDDSNNHKYRVRILKINHFKKTKKYHTITIMVNIHDIHRLLWIFKDKLMKYGINFDTKKQYSLIIRKKHGRDYDVESRLFNYLVVDDQKITDYNSILEVVTVIARDLEKEYNDENNIIFVNEFVKPVSTTHTIFLKFNGKTRSFSVKFVELSSRILMEMILNG